MTETRKYHISMAPCYFAIFYQILGKCHKKYKKAYFAIFQEFLGEKQKRNLKGWKFNFYLAF
jgi:hypothetical protein